MAWQAQSDTVARIHALSQEETEQLAVAYKAARESHAEAFGALGGEGQSEGDAGALWRWPVNGVGVFSHDVFPAPSQIGPHEAAARIPAPHVFGVGILIFHRVQIYSPAQGLTRPIPGHVHESTELAF